MELLNGQVFVKKSSIPSSGNGLYTKKFIPKGACIVEYKGRISSWKEVRHNEGENGYIYYVNRNHVIDAASFKKSLGRYANDARGIIKVKGVSNNAEYITQGLKVYIKATRDIAAGSEILVGYGKEYWDVIRYNNNLKLKQSVPKKGQVQK